MAALRLKHPSRKKLRAWLSGQGTAELDKHLSTCQRCAATLEALESEGGSDPIDEALATLFAPPQDLSDRLERKVHARLDSRVMFDVVTDLFGAGIEASKLLLTEEHPDG